MLGEGTEGVGVEGTSREREMKLTTKVCFWESLSLEMVGYEF